jgi:CheY-like chemotaxis protein
MEKRILVADDDFLLRCMTKSQLERLCKSMNLTANIDDVSTGKEAIEMAKATEYHLIVLDNNMESYDNGLKAIVEIREFRKEVPMILYTSGLDDTAKELAVRNAGAEIAIKNGCAELGEVELVDVARKYLQEGKQNG